MRTFLLLTLIFALGGVILPADSQAASVYRWTDENGTVHFGERPPEGSNAVLVNTTNTTHGVTGTQPKEPASRPNADSEDDEPFEEELSAADKSRRDRAERQAKAREEQEQIDLNCAAMRSQLAWAEPNPRVMVQDKKTGEVRRMDDSERLDLVNEAKTYIAENCD